MAAVNKNSLAKFIGKLFIRPVGSNEPKTRLASVRGLVANIDTSELVEILADDTGTVYKATKNKANIEVELLENMDRDLLALLFPGNSTNVDGSPVVGETKDILEGFEYDTAYEVKEGASVTSVVGSVDGALIDGTGYTLTNVNGVLTITFIAGVTTTSQVITVTYDYTPSISEVFTFNVDNSEVKSFEVTIEAYDEEGNERTIVLSDAGFTSTYNMSFLDIVEAGDIKGSDLTFEGNKGSVLTYENSII